MFFDSLVAEVRASTSDDQPPSFTAAPLDCVLRAFRPLTVADVVTAVRLLPDKQCNSDPLPTRLLKVNIDVLAPFLVELFNRSLSFGVVPTVFKLAYITISMLDLIDRFLICRYRRICWSVSSLSSLLTTSSRRSCCLGSRVPTELTTRQRRPF